MFLKYFLCSALLSVLFFTPATWGFPGASPFQRPRSAGKIYRWVDKDGRKHFTDDISSIPAEYRDQLEGQQSTTRRPPSSGVGPVDYGSVGVVGGHVLELHRVGASLFVEVELEGHHRSRFLVDTGATDTVISTDLARRISLDPESMGLFPLRSASGVFLARLGKLGAIRTGQVTVRDLNVFVYDTGHPGILGMSFLENFSFTMNSGQDQLILSPPRNPSWAKVLGGQTEEWWRRKFLTCRNQIESLRGYMAGARELQDSEMEQGFARSLRHFEEELFQLERRAQAAGVPYHWRK